MPEPDARPHRTGRFALAAAAAAFAAAAAAPGAHAAAARQQGAAPPPLVANGDFEADKNADGWPDGWSRLKEGAQWPQEGGNRFLRLVSQKPGQTLLLYRAVAVPTGTKALELTWRWRATDLKPGKEAWFDARLLLDFKDAVGKKLTPSPAAPYLRASTNGWREGKLRITVPDGAKTLEFMPALFQVERGTLDLDDIRIAAVAAEAAAPKPGTAAAVSDAPEEAQPARWPKPLKVVGNRLHDPDGKEVWLQGMNVVSLEWGVKGETVLRSARVAVDDWKGNVVRLPVREDYWFGKGPGQTDGGAGYRALVDAAVTVVANRGAYLLLDLHRFRAPRPEHLAFWKDAAVRYKDHPAVLFDLFNEPHGISWKVWRDGGFVPDKETPADEDAFLSDADKAKSAAGFTSPGMQKLIDAVREAGARNIVVVGGLDWAYDLTGILNGYALTDKTGNGIVYGSHVYPWKSDWKEKVLAAAAKHPVLIGEVGADIKKMSFLPDDRQEDPYTWAPDMLGFIQEHRLHWTAFSFHPKATPVMISDWDYTPTPFWGAFVRAALRGGKFGLNRMR